MVFFNYLDRKRQNEADKTEVERLANTYLPNLAQQPGNEWRLLCELLMLMPKCDFEFSFGAGIASIEFP